MASIPLHEATGPVLNWLVAKSLGLDVIIETAQMRRDQMLHIAMNMSLLPDAENLRAALKALTPQLKFKSDLLGMQPVPDYCSDRSFSAALAEENQIGTIPRSDGTWRAYALGGDGVFQGETPAIASMRCKVGTVLGLHPEVPIELLHWEVSGDEIEALIESHQQTVREATERPSCN